MTRLSVNINKFATLRNARGGNNPDVRQVAIDCERFGAQGITVHPRPDERHIRRKDVYEIAKAITVEFNIEGYPSPDFLKMIEEVKPAQCTLVPDPPGVLTSNAGWDVLTHKAFLHDVVSRIKAAGVRTSLFLNPDLKQVDAAKEVGADRIELYTEPYAREYPVNPVHAISPYIHAARHAQIIHIGLNAGHDLSLENLRYFKENIVHLEEVSIGHALVCDALYMGLERSIQAYLDCLK
jgi:pyridoxine 5-phosphate synthase